MPPTTCCTLLLSLSFSVFFLSRSSGAFFFQPGPYWSFKDLPVNTKRLWRDSRTVSQEFQSGFMNTGGTPARWTQTKTPKKVCVWMYFPKVAWVHLIICDDWQVQIGIKIKKCVWEKHWSIHFRMPAGGWRLSQLPLGERGVHPGHPGQVSSSSQHQHQKTFTPKDKLELAFHPSTQMLAFGLWEEEH